MVDFSKPIRFRFDHQAMSGFSGDTLASALLANGKKLVGRSFKYHRPRGVFTAGSEEPNALVELRSGGRREPNTKATTIELYEGLEASSQNCWPSVDFDLLAVNSMFSPLFSAGFYYKTFMWPAAFWERVYEPLIRRAAGLGRGASEPDPDHYEHIHAFCDILIIGSGPSGLAAALAAGRSGARVILCDEDFRFGGRLLSERYEIDGMPGASWAEAAVAELSEFENVRLLPRTAVFGAYDGETFGACERVADHLQLAKPHQPRQRLWHIVARRSIVATGAIERGIVFGGNDRPGIMTASAARSYANRFAVAPGERLAVFTNNNDGWQTAIDLAKAGKEVAAIIDTRTDLPEHLIASAAGTRVIAGGSIVATHGRKAIDRIEVKSSSSSETIKVDWLAVSGGWNANLGLTCHRGVKPVWSERLSTFLPGEQPTGFVPVGAANGAMTLAACLVEGTQAGNRAVQDLGFSVVAGKPAAASDELFAVTPLWRVADSKQKAFVDLQNDVTEEDVILSAQEGFRSVEHLKRYTTLGMATDQGKTSSMGGLAIMAELTGRSIPQTGITTYRPPYVPVAIGAFAGPHRGKRFRPTRLTPSHAWAEKQGAVFVETGPWLRAQYFPKPGEGDWLATVSREVRTVRNAVGFCDVSTLGKIDLQGPDAGKFLDRLYINTFSTLAVGKARYGVMLREDGFAMDDGTTSRFSDDRFFVTMTTANAGRIFQHMKFCHQVLWPELDVQFVSVTDEWAQFSIAGPRARETLAALVADKDRISNERLPYMGVAEIRLCDAIPARIYRLSFSGELAFEIGVPARYGEALANALMEAGEPFGIAPYGTEALGVMRIEKGHIGGSEIDGRTSAADLGFARMMSKKKDYIGRTLAERPALNDPGRMAFVGFKPIDLQSRLGAGAHCIPLNAVESAENDQGFVTSAAFSPSLGHWIALGLLSNGPRRVGEHVLCVDPVRDRRVEVEVCNPCFIDLEGVRLRD